MEHNEQELKLGDEVLTFDVVEDNTIPNSAFCFFCTYCQLG